MGSAQMSHNQQNFEINKEMMNVYEHIHYFKF